MQTGKIVLREIEEMMNDFKPTYIPLMPLFLSVAQVYKIEEGKIKFTSLDAVGDLRAKLMGAKDSELHTINSKEGSKTFNKYFFGAKYKQSNLQDTAGYERVTGQTLDEHNVQNDELFMGTDVNSGLYTSTDPNYDLKASYEVKKDSDGEHLADLYQKMISTVEEANAVDGEKLVLVYGENMIAKYNGLFGKTNTAFSKTLGDALPGVNIEKIPKKITPAGENGFVVVNMNQIKVHYCTLPKILDQGVNAEDMYTWTNFIIGSSMVDCLVKGAILRQPVTFQA